jgi:hypothetical protein
VHDLADYIGAEIAARPPKREEVKPSSFGMAAAESIKRLFGR